MKGKQMLQDITADDFDFVCVCNKKIKNPMRTFNLMPLELILFILQEQFMQDLAKV